MSNSPRPDPAIETPAPLTPLGWVPSFLLFGGGAVLLFLATRFEVPWLVTKIGMEPVVGWFVAGAVGVFVPLALVGWVVLASERRVEGQTLGSRLWLRKLTKRDTLWCLGGFLAIGLTTGSLALGMQAWLGPDALRPEFAAGEPLSWGRYWILAAWFPCWLANILGEEFLWRSVMLPRQEVAFGRKAWMVNAAGWLLFHAAFPWPLLVSLIPTVIILPYVVQQTRNAWLGVILHGGLNGPAFVAISMGWL